MRPLRDTNKKSDPQMGRLLQQISDKSNELWLLAVSLQELKLKDEELFDKQDFQVIKERCEHVLRLLRDQRSRP